MALEITTIPVLTGDVAEKFEAHATMAYQNMLERKKNNTTRRSSYEKGMNLVKEILSHSNLQESLAYCQQLLCLARQVGTLGPSLGHSGTKPWALTDQATGIRCP